LKWGIHFDLEKKKIRIAEIDQIMAEPDFWDDTNKAQKLMKELTNLKGTVEEYKRLKSEYDDVATLIQIGYEENDETLVAEIDESLNQFIKDLEELKLKTMLSGPYDSYNAILTLHAGAGGTESCDWASMLLRMFQRWADKRGFSTEILDFLDGDEAGLKSVTLQVNGENAFGYLQSERGVHRLVRISPFNAAGKRQTSFVSCDVMPDIEDDTGIEIDDKDLRIDTYRSSGAGGQHVNKTSSAVRITHLPTSTVVQCQNERSQLQNKDRAMKMLKAKLYLMKQQENQEMISGIRGEVKEIGWGNQIRSYVLQPYTMVKDHRTNEEVGNVAGVLDGNLDPFINAYLIWNAQNKL
jgi:peptide chain release factor 2